MQAHPILGHVALGYSPVIDRQRSVLATRLTVFPSRPDAQIDGAALLQALQESFPDGRSLLLRVPPKHAVTLVLNLAGESLLQSVLAAPPVPRFMIEVPSFIASDPAQSGLLAAAALAAPLALKGPLRSPLPTAVASAFAASVVDDDVGTGGAGLPRLRAGITRLGELDGAFAKNAVAAVGWPFGDPPVGPAKATVAPEIKTILELINRVDAEEPVDRLEALLKNDPTLAFRLLRYINSPAFGLSVEVSSFRHALMILGYQRLKRWLALLLASASKDASMKPVMFAAVRRGLLMEELVKASDDKDMRGEMFICGVFSLLDRLLRQSFAELLRSVPVPERVRQALGSQEGPFQPYLELVQAIENESVIDIRECADKLMIGPAEVNRALLAALAAAAQLE